MRANSHFGRGRFWGDRTRFLVLTASLLSLAGCLGGPNPSALQAQWETQRAMDQTQWMVMNPPPPVVPRPVIQPINLGGISHINRGY